MNVEDWEAAALHEIVARIEAEAAARGAEVVGSELVGLMPAGAAAAAAGAVLRIDGFDASRVLELRLLDVSAIPASPTSGEGERRGREDRGRRDDRERRRDEQQPGRVRAAVRERDQAETRPSTRSGSSSCAAAFTSTSAELCRDPGQRAPSTRADRLPASANSP